MDSSIDTVTNQVEETALIDCIVSGQSSKFEILVGKYQRSSAIVRDAFQWREPARGPRAREGVGTGGARGGQSHGDAS